MKKNCAKNATTPSVLQKLRTEYNKYLVSRKEMCIDDNECLPSWKCHNQSHNDIDVSFQTRPISERQFRENLRGQFLQGIDGSSVQVARSPTDRLLLC